MAQACGSMMPMCGVAGHQGKGALVVNCPDCEPSYVWDSPGANTLANGDSVKPALTRAQETRAIKKDLKAAGLDVLSVRRGNGTSWGWIYIDLRVPERHGLNTKALREKVEAVMKNYGRDVEKDARVGYCHSKFLIQYVDDEAAWA